MKNRLYLASQSPSRQYLLKKAKIPFVLLKQTADEQMCDWGLPLDALVSSIALYKMEHVQIPKAKEGAVIFVLTADTLSRDKSGIIQGKPKNRNDAIAKIKCAREGTQLCTAFCLDKKRYGGGKWHTIERIHQTVRAEYSFIVPDEWIEEYLANTISIACSNAIAVEQYGNQFLKKVNGSYSAIIGLPMFELRQGLERLGFFN